MKPVPGKHQPTPGILLRLPSEKPPAEPRALPFVFVNMAMTADGKTATANHSISAFSSQRDQQHLYELRAQADAVMCGARTADQTNIHLGPGPARYRRMRLRRGLAEYNLRVIVSGSGSVNPRAAVFLRRFSPIIVLTTERTGARRLKRLCAVADEVWLCGKREVDFRRTFAWLRRRWGIRRLLCEGGGELNAALFAAGLVREVHLTICPLVFGGRRAPTLADGVGVARLAEAAQFELKSVRRVDDEFFLVLRALPRRRRVT
jgi:riboflavin-specific deaminase-like protein